MSTWKEGCPIWSQPLYHYGTVTQPQEDSMSLEPLTCFSACYVCGVRAWKHLLAKGIPFKCNTQNVSTMQQLACYTLQSHWVWSSLIPLQVSPVFVLIVYWFTLSIIHRSGRMGFCVLSNRRTKWGRPRNDARYGQ